MLLRRCPARDRGAGRRLVVAAVISKFVGCGLGALGLGRADAIRVGVGMIPRGEVGMVVAQIGLGFGILSRSSFAVVVFMSVATTVIAPVLMRAVFKSPARRPAANSADASSGVY